MNKNSHLKNLLLQKCPRCHTGNVFEVPNMYKLKYLGKMNSACPNCGESFKREPGFYFGAAYVSYGLMVGIGLLLALIVHLITGSLFDHANLFLIIAVIVDVLLMPPVFRYSRIIFLYFFVGFDGSKQ